MVQLIVCSIIAIALLAGSLIWGIRRRSGKSIVIATTFGVGSAVLIFRFFALLPKLEGGIGNRILTVLLTFGRSIVHTLQTFSLDEDYDYFLHVLQEKCEPGFFFGFLTVFNTILNVLAPVMTLAFILALLEELISRVRASTRPASETFIFSELNERTVTLAEDIKQHKRKAFLLFTDTYVGSDDEQKNELRERVRRIGAVCVKEDITTMRLHHHAEVPITFVLADTNEYENLRVAAWLSRGNKKLDQLVFANVLIFCTSGDAGTTVQATILNRSNPNMRFIAVNDCVYPIYQLLTDHPLFARMEESKDPAVRKKCTVLIVGCGYVGMECVKAITWCGQLANTDLKIRVVSDDAEEKGRGLTKECPELFSTGLYDIAFRSIDVSGDEFIKYLKDEVPEACYVIVALGSNQRDIAISLEVQKAYNRLHLQGGKAPQICSFITDDSLFSIFSQQNQGEARENECLLVPFGNDKSRFSVESIFNNDLDKMALAVHLTYWGLPVDFPKELLAEVKKEFLAGKRFDRTTKDPEDQYTVSRRYLLSLFNRCFRHGRFFIRMHCAFLSLLRRHPAAPVALREALSKRETAIAGYFNSVYGQNSSHASALHLRYKLHVAGIPATGKIGEEELKKYDRFAKDDDNMVEIAKLEHLRWNAYMRSVGYVCPTESEFDTYAFKSDNTQQQRQLLLHPCLVDWDEQLGKVLTPEDFELYERQDPAFLRGRFLHELDELDRVSLKVWLTRKQRRGRDRKDDYKAVDEIIIRNASTILRCVASSEETI